MRKITTEAGQIEKSDVQIAGKKHDKADSQQSGRILSSHRKRTAQIPGQQCDIEKGGRRKEAAFYMPEIREKKQEEHARKAAGSKREQRTVLQTAMAVLHCDKKQDCRKFKGSLQKKNIGCEGKIRDNKRNSVFTGLLLSKTGYAMHDVHLAARMPETFLNSVCTEK